MILKVIAYNKTKNSVILDSGEQVKITNMFHKYGKETRFISECDRFVAGPDSQGNWHVDYPENFDATKH